MKKLPICYCSWSYYTLVQLLHTTLISKVTGRDAIINYEQNILLAFTKVILNQTAVLQERSIELAARGLI